MICRGNVAPATMDRKACNFETMFTPQQPLPSRARSTESTYFRGCGPQICEPYTGPKVHQNSRVGVQPEGKERVQGLAGFKVSKPDTLKLSTPVGLVLFG